MSELIPRVIHRVWTGLPAPIEVRDNWVLWAHVYPRASHMAWTEENIHTLRAYPALAKLPAFKDPRVRSDYVRLAAMLEFGGLYVDSDAVPLVNESTLEGICKTAWLAGHRTKQYKHGVRILNGAMCAPPAHPFLQKIFATAMINAQSGLTDAHKLAGPHVYMDLYDDSIEILPIFDILYEAAAKKGDFAYLREASPLAPFVFLGE